MIDRHIEVHLVARRAELRRLLPHERLEEHAAVWLRIQLDGEIVQHPNQRVLAGCELVQLGIFEVEVGLSHRAFYVRDGVAHHAAQSGLSFGSVHELFDRRIHSAGIEHRRIMASAAPFGRLGADRILHVLDRFAIPLVVERRKMVGGTVPLVVNIFMTTLAGIRLHEELARNLFSTIDLR